MNGEGTNIELDGTMAAKLAEIELMGNTTQNVTGKNLLSFPDSTNSQTGVDWVVSNGVAVGSGQATGTSTVITRYQAIYLSPGRYTFSIQSATNYDVILTLTDLSQQDHWYTIPAGQTSKTFVLDFTAYRQRLGASGWKNGDNVSMTVTHPQLEKGTVATTYEAFTMLLAPDTPQPLQVVTGQQDIMIRGKNLYNPNDMLQSSGTQRIVYDSGWQTIWGQNTGSSGDSYNNFFSNPLPIDPDTDCTVILEIKDIRRMNVKNTGYLCICGNSQAEQMTGSAQVSFGAFENYTKPGIYTFYVKTRPAGSSYTFGLRSFLATGPKSFQRVTFRISVIEGKNIDINHFNYEPYQKYTIDLGNIELKKVENYQDIICKNGDDWYLREECGKIVIDGNGPTWSIQNATGDGMSNYYYVRTSYYDSSARTATFQLSNSDLLPNWRSGITEGNVVPYETYVLYERASSTSAHLRMFLLKSRLTEATSEDVNTFFANNPMTIYYDYNNIVNTKITDTALIGQLNALADAIGADEKTYIEVVPSGNNLASPLRVTAYKKNIMGVSQALGSS